MADDETADDIHGSDIAIVGMAGRFPGAPDVDALWQAAVTGRDCLSRVNDADLEQVGVPREVYGAPEYVRRGGFLDDVECFDAPFFGFGPRDASIMDPQHRHFLETAWAALESAGHPPSRFDGPIGVFAGSGMNTYLMHNLLTNPQLVASVGWFLLRHTGNDKDFLTTQASYLLNLKGPSVNIQTACSTSLVAIHLAAQSLLGGECDLALAGGVTIEFPHRQGYTYQDGEILAPDGYCRPFEARSAGTVLTSGVGIVVLRRLADALRDGDHVHAVIKATAVNNDGSDKVSFLAPSVDGHASVVVEAQALAGVEPDTIEYIEAHGTGTNIGDPIEVAALTQAFRMGTDATAFCRLGSTKANIGHLDTAAGVASVIKTALALEHRILPPLANFEGPNPLIDFPSTPFVVSAEPAKWAEAPDHPRRAGVSSLGVGGTNAHAVLEEAPEPPVRSGEVLPTQLLVVSAKTDTALDASTARLAAWLCQHPDADLADVAWTLQVGRDSFARRRTVAARSSAEAVSLLAPLDPRRVTTATLAPDAAPASVVFMFPGGGAQYPGMGAELYHRMPEYRAGIDECLGLLDPIVEGGAATLRRLMFPAADIDDIGRDEVASTIERAMYSLPAVFATSWATARLLRSWNIEPDAMTGHSLGEYVAACLAGVMTLGEALTIVMLRARLFERVAGGGGMLAVPLSEHEVAGLLPEGVAVATVNAPSQCVVSGRVDAIAVAERLLADQGIEVRRVPLAIAPHSPMLDPVLDEFRAGFAAVSLQPPQRPFVSNLTGRWITDEQATSADYWTRHLRETVRFADGIATLSAETPQRVFVEVGPGHALSSFVRQQPNPSRAVVASLRHPDDTISDLAHTLGALGRLWAGGVAVDWSALHAARPARRIPLPTYAFDRQRHWVEPGRVTIEQPGASRSTGSAGSAALRRIDDVAQWGWRPVWVEQARPSTPARVAASGTSRAGTAAPATARSPIGAWFVVSAAPHDPLVAGLVGALDARLIGPGDLLPLDASSTEPVGVVVDAAVGIDATLFLARQLVDDDSRPVRLIVWTVGARSAGGTPVIAPRQIMPAAAIRVVPREAPWIGVVSVDVAAADPVGCLDELVAEITGSVEGAEVALRPGGSRFVAELQAVTLAPTSSDVPPGTGELSDRGYLGDGSFVDGLPLRARGVYVVTGGLGGIGLVLARWLAERCHARVVLVGRHAPAEAVVEARALAVDGAEVHVKVADLTDAAAVHTLVDDIVATIGPINGVFHAAGTLDDAPIASTTPERMHAVLAPKVAGIEHLAEAVDHANLDVFVVCSSTSARLGLPGQFAYVAANAYLDAFVASQGAPFVAVDWGVWNGVGMAGRTPVPTGDDPRPSAHPMLTDVAHSGETLVARAHLSSETTWALDEHRLLDGPPVLPGTAYLELAVAALSDPAGDALGSAGGASIGGQPGPGVWRLSDVWFVAALLVPEGSAADLVVSARGEHGALSWSIQSSPSGREHAFGSAAFVEHADRPVDIDLEDLRRRLPIVLRGDLEDYNHQAAHIRFGPRFRCVDSLRLGDGEALAALALPEGPEGHEGPGAPGNADMGFVAHPALLDMATGVALALVPGYDDDDRLVVPIGAAQVTFYDRLVGTVFSHIRLRPDATLDSASFDVSICDETGRVLVDIEEFTVRRVADVALLSETPSPSVGAATIAGHAGGDELVPVALGITRPEGRDAIERILVHTAAADAIEALDGHARDAADGHDRRWLISSIDLNDMARRIDDAHRPVVAGGATDTTEGTSPRSSDPIEATLLDAWSELLGVADVGIDDNFFDLGGHSLIAVRLFSRVRRTYQVDFTLSTLFSAPTVGDLAVAIRERAPESVLAALAQETPLVAQRAASAGSAPSLLGSLLVPIKPSGTRLPFFCVHGAGGEVLSFAPLAMLIDANQPFYGIRALGSARSETPLNRIETMAARYLGELRRVQPEGPYHLGGYSGGGVIAFEMAQQLIRQGHEVALCVLFDTYRPGLRMYWAGRAAYKLARSVANPAELRALVDRLRQREPMADVALRELDDPSDDYDEEIEARDERRRLRAVVTKATFQALDSYKITPYPGTIVLLRSAELASRDFLSPRDRGWGRLAAHLEIRDIPGDHYKMFEPPNVSVVGSRLDEVLAEAHARVATRR